MKTKPKSKTENQQETSGARTITLPRAREIMKEEGIEYTDEELTEVLQFISKVVSITTAHYERTKQTEAKIISINTNTTHETKSISLHQSKYRRAS